MGSQEEGYGYSTGEAYGYNHDCDYANTYSFYLTRAAVRRRMNEGTI